MNSLDTSPAHRSVAAKGNARFSEAPCNCSLVTPKCDSTVRYLGVELKDAMSIAERIDI